MATTEEFIATGRRKTSVARIRMAAGNGKIEVNGRNFEDYFPTVPLQNTVLQPLQAVKLTNSYNLTINTSGGGATGQAGAARLAIARALLQVDANLRGTLKTEGLLSRDPRMQYRTLHGRYVGQRAAEPRLGEFGFFHTNQFSTLETGTC